MEWENDILIVIIYENEVQKMCVEQYDKKTLIDLKKNPLKMTSEYLTKLE